MAGLAHQIRNGIKFHRELGTMPRPSCPEADDFATAAASTLAAGPERSADWRHLDNEKQPEATEPRGQNPCHDGRRHEPPALFYPWFRAFSDLVSLADRRPTVKGK